MIDERITSTCFYLGEWPLSTIFLKNNKHYPWLILVPRYANVQDMDQLPEGLQQQLMREICHLSRIVREQFKPDKLNVGALGNIVSQLHIHVIARFKDDELWPHGVWQEAQLAPIYSVPPLFIAPLRAKIEKNNEILSSILEV